MSDQTPTCGYCGECIKLRTVKYLGDDTQADEYWAECDHCGLRTPKVSSLADARTMIHEIGELLELLNEGIIVAGEHNE